MRLDDTFGIQSTGLIRVGDKRGGLVDKHSSDVRDPIQVVLHPLEAVRLPVLAHPLKTHHVERGGGGYS
jgi:hypothetical protein